MGQLSIDMQMRGPLGLRDRLDLDRELIYLKATNGHRDGTAAPIRSA